MAGKIQLLPSTADNTSCGVVSFFLFDFSSTYIWSTKTPKRAQSDHATRPCFHIGSDAFLTPSSTPKTPSSWPPRPDSTGLGPTCVADHVVSFHAQKSSVSLKPHVVTHVVMSLSPSWIVVKAREHERDVVFVFRKTGPCVLKHRIVQRTIEFYDIENENKTILS